MKRILAIIMVLAMVFAFAACKPKDDGKDTTAPGVSGDAVTNDNNESVPADASEADSTGVSTSTGCTSVHTVSPVGCRSYAEKVATLVASSTESKPLIGSSLKPSATKLTTKTRSANSNIGAATYRPGRQIMTRTITDDIILNII